MASTEKLYNRPLIYDIAFSYRDFEKEFNFLKSTYEKINNCSPQSFLELAAGPGDHAIEAAKQALLATALDLEPEMSVYGREKSKRTGVQVEHLTADMSQFKTQTSYDLVATMLDSLCHLNNLECLVRHFECVQNVLNPKGLYIIETSHPKSYFSNAETTCDSWTVEKLNSVVNMKWSALGEVNPITQQLTYVAQAQGKIDGEAFDIEEHFLARLHTYGELELAASQSGLKIIKSYGDFKELRLDEAEAWRMILVLSKDSK